MRCTIWRISLKLRITMDSLPMEIIVAWTVSGLRGLAWEPAQMHKLTYSSHTSAMTMMTTMNNQNDDNEMSITLIGKWEPTQMHILITHVCDDDVGSDDDNGNHNDFDDMEVGTFRNVNHIDWEPTQIHILITHVCDDNDDNNE